MCVLACENIVIEIVSMNDALLTQKPCGTNLRIDFQVLEISAHTISEDERRFLTTEMFANS